MVALGTQLRQHDMAGAHIGNMCVAGVACLLHCSTWDTALAHTALERFTALCQHTCQNMWSLPACMIITMLLKPPRLSKMTLSLSASGSELLPGTWRTAFQFMKPCKGHTTQAIPFVSTCTGCTAKQLAACALLLHLVNGTQGEIGLPAVQHVVWPRLRTAMMLVAAV